MNFSFLYVFRPILFVVLICFFTGIFPSGLSAAVAQAVDPLTVDNVIIDKTGENAVTAKEQAILEAQRQAFRQLVKRNVSAEDFKSFEFPEDEVVFSLVQDFEIRDERLTATRYAARFSVRFREGVKNYVEIVQPEMYDEQVVFAPSEENEIAPVKGVRSFSASLLILPYLETNSGQTYLWEDNNDWRGIWQSGKIKFPKGERRFVLPLGDISDLAAGPSMAVFSGDYTVIEKLRAHYGVEEVILAVANKSGAGITVDIYSYRDKAFSRVAERAPVTSLEISAEQGWMAAARDVIAELQKNAVAAALPETQQEAAVADISRSVVDRDDETAASVAPETVDDVPATTVAGGKSMVEATMTFSDFSQWMAMQKKLSAMIPPVKVDITSLTKSGAQFSLVFEGSVDTLRKTLQENGIAIERPSVVVDPSVLGGDGSAAPRAVYDLRFAQ